MHSFPGGSAIKSDVHSHGDLESLCWDRVASVLENFDRTPLRQNISVPEVFFMLFWHFGPFFDHPTSIIFT
jgi:hypothetical protein